MVTCECGEVIGADDIEYNNSCNEEGEDYCVMSASCPDCGNFYETNSWGELDFEGVVERLKDYIND